MNDEGDNVAIVGTFRVGSMAGVETWEVDMMIQSDSIKEEFCFTSKGVSERASVHFHQTSFIVSFYLHFNHHPKHSVFLYIVEYDVNV